MCLPGWQLNLARFPYVASFTWVQRGRSLIPTDSLTNQFNIGVAIQRFA